MKKITRMNKERCAFDRGKRCEALTKKDCHGCSFYKTCDELGEGRDSAAVRMAKLDPDLKTYIRFKYYGDRRRYDGG